jgi:hypothetical protein
MKNYLLIFVLIAVAGTVAGQTPAKRYPIVFYSIENAFDTIKDSGSMDDEFTPAGPKKWNTQKYRTKMGNLERAFFAMSASMKDYPAIIGLSEVENRNVLNEIASMPKLRKANYQAVHYDSPDPRGIDVALLYRPDIFRYEGSQPIPTLVPSLPGFKTRDILSVWGTIEDEPFCFFVCHWSSRRGGETTSDFKRIGAAKSVRTAADSIMTLRPDTKIVIMGDFNDDPVDESLWEVLGAKGERDKIATRGYYNPYWEMYMRGYGVMDHNDSWNVFDAIIVNHNLMNPEGQGLKLVRSERSVFWGNIFDHPMLKHQSGQYENYPLRTFAGNTFRGGYSDHFPVYIFVSR